MCESTSIILRGHEARTYSRGDIIYGYDTSQFTSSEQDYQSSVWMGKYERGEINSEQFIRGMNSIGITMSVAGGRIGGYSGENSQPSNFIPAEAVAVIFNEQLSYENSLSAASLFDSYNAGIIDDEGLKQQLNELSAMAIKTQEIGLACYDKGTYETGKEPSYYVIDGAKVYPGILDWLFPTAYAPGVDDVPLREWVEDRHGSVTPNYGLFGKLKSVTVSFGDVSHEFTEDDYYIMNDRTYISEAKIRDVFETTGVGAANEYQEIVSLVEIGGSVYQINNINCYAFAIGYESNAQPGWMSEKSINYLMPYTVDTVASYVVSDLNAMGRNARIIDGVNGKILPNERRIAVRVGTQPTSIGSYDYHFMAQNSDGTWSEKHGQYQTSISHPSGNPDNIPWMLGDEEYYDSTIIYMAITN